MAAVDLECRHQWIKEVHIQETFTGRPGAAVYWWRCSRCGEVKREEGG